MRAIVGVCKQLFETFEAALERASQQLCGPVDVALRGGSARPQREGRDSVGVVPRRVRDYEGGAPPHGRSIVASPQEEEAQQRGHAGGGESGAAAARRWKTPRLLDGQAEDGADQAREHEVARLKISRRRR